MLARMRGGFVYIMSNRKHGTLYVGVTADIVRRAYEHRTGGIEGFTRRYGLKWLIWFEQHDEIVPAIQREKSIKNWPRAWKVRLVETMNPAWEDLYPTLL
jgi:putative endonuclease